MAITLIDDDWTARALCRAYVWPSSARMPEARSERELVALCRTCPVRAECLDHARRTHESLGVWGGLTSAERRVLRD